MMRIQDDDTPMLGVLGDVNGLHMLDSPNLASAKNVRENSLRGGL